MRRGSPTAYTLAEVLLVMALVGLLYALLMFVVVQVSQVSRRTSVAALRQLELVKATEQLRWQLRCLYSQVDPQPSNTTSGANSTSANNSSSNASAIMAARYPGMLGEPGVSLVGQRAAEGRDILLFQTTYPKGKAGVVEVGYKMADNRAEAADLLFRQFPARHVAGFHNQQDHTEAPWVPLLHNVRQFAVDYSPDGLVWQREWELTYAPRRVRIHLEIASGESLDFQIVPGIGAARW